MVWIIKSLLPNGILHHNLDDFIFKGKPHIPECLAFMSIFHNMCSELGVPLAAEEKNSLADCFWPTEIMVFLGFEEIH